MRNFNMLDSKTVQLPSGVFAGAESIFCYPGGELEGIRLSEKNLLVTHIGELVPAYTETHRRKNKYSVEFYKSGKIKAVALDEIQEIITPIGEMPAELVTFFETGELMRFFPLDGKISGMWSEEDEKKLAISLSFELPFTKFTAVISGIAFYKSGDIRSITLYPGESAALTASCGVIKTGVGFSLFESGELESAEPVEPISIETPIGKIFAYDPNATGVNADTNSLMFDKQGRVVSLITVHNRIAAQTDGGRLLMFSPREVINPLDGESMITDGMKISFDYDKDTVTFETGGDETTLPLSGCGFTVTAYTGGSNACSPADCASCSLKCK